MTNVVCEALAEGQLFVQIHYSSRWARVCLPAPSPLTAASSQNRGTGPSTTQFPLHLSQHSLPTRGRGAAEPPDNKPAIPTTCQAGSCHFALTKPGQRSEEQPRGGRRSPCTPLSGRLAQAGGPPLLPPAFCSADSSS